MRPVVVHGPCLCLRSVVRSVKDKRTLFLSRDTHTTNQEAVATYQNYAFVTPEKSFLTSPVCNASWFVKLSHTADKFKRFTLLVECLT